MAFETGENIGAYRIIEKLGHGGMATVYKAYHARLDRFVALKVLHPAFLEDPNFLARFQREARVVAKLEHPNIVPIYDFADHQEQPYLVMKYIEGETLKALLKRGRLSVEQIWGVVNAVGAGLGYAHEQGILHRDVKPSNVIMAKDGKIYLADFGLARIAQAGESTLTSDMIMGTPQYISPEQAMGEKNLDNRTDIYSFGVMLYEMVVGQVPFSSDTPFSIIHDHIYSPLPLPHLINPGVPDEVERVLLKALAKERNDRYETVEALCAAFKKAWDDAKVDMADVTMTSPVPPIQPQHSPTATTLPPQETTKKRQPEPKTKKNAKQTRWLLISGGILLLAAIVFALSSLGQDNLARNIPKQAAENNSENAPLPLPIGADSPSVDLIDAQEWVTSAPNDPYAHLNLALVLLETSPEQRKPIEQALKTAGTLAQGDTAFFEDAGYSLMEYNAWTESALMFQQGLENLSPQENFTEEYDTLLYGFIESVYKAANQPNMPASLPFDQIAAIDEPISQIAKARYAFYQGKSEDALAILRNTKKQYPDLPEALLLEGEILAQSRKFKQAEQTFNTLLEFEELPDWIYIEAEAALSQLP
jgi:serine/threonine protein kinase